MEKEATKPQVEVKDDPMPVVEFNHVGKHSQGTKASDNTEKKPGTGGPMGHLGH